MPRSAEAVDDFQQLVALDVLLAVVVVPPFVDCCRLVDYLIFLDKTMADKRRLDHMA